jgi:hypothetical protein
MQGFDWYGRTRHSGHAVTRQSLTSFRANWTQSRHLARIASVRPRSPSNTPINRGFCDAGTDLRRFSCAVVRRRVISCHPMPIQSGCGCLPLAMPWFWGQFLSTRGIGGLLRLATTLICSPGKWRELAGGEESRFQELRGAVSCSWTL